MRRLLLALVCCSTLLLVTAAKDQDKRQKRFDDLAAKILHDLQAAWPEVEIVHL